MRIDFFSKEQRARWCRVRLKNLVILKYGTSELVFINRLSDFFVEILCHFIFLNYVIKVILLNIRIKFLNYQRLFQLFIKELWELTN
jgi:hypothetical protein